MVGGASRQKSKVGVPLPLQGNKVFYVLAILTILTSILVRTMSLLSCTIVFALSLIPLYGIIVAGVPFSVDVVLCFDGAHQHWPPTLNIENSEAPNRADLPHSNSHHPRGDTRGGVIPMKRLDDADNTSGDNRDLGVASAADDERRVGRQPRATPEPDNADAKYAPETVVPGWTSDRAPPSLFKDLDAKTFLLRSGPDYAKTKRKIPSLAAFYDLKHADIFWARGSGCVLHIAKNVDFSKLVPDRKANGWVDGAPRVIVSSLQFCDEGDSGWFGKDESNTKTFSFVMFFVLNKTGEAAMKEDIPAARLFKRFCREELDVTRFKTIIKIMDKDKLGLPYILRKSMDQLDGKPFLAGKLKDNKSARYVGDCYLEFDTLIQNYTFIARKGIATCKGKLNLIKFEYGITIEGQENDEMPENILGAASIGPGIDYMTMSKGVNWRVSDSVL